jgi:zinc/manganese transport system substrate-binding protein/manganese/iron transport system substrate-binding protein
MRLGWALSVACFVLAFAFPGPVLAQSPAQPVPDPIMVVATTTVLADLVAQTGGPLVNATSIVPRGGEVHTFDPSPEDAFRIAEADLIVMNGLGLDDWLGELIEVAGAAATPILELGAGLSEMSGPSGSLPAETPGPAQGDEPANPHVWLDVAYAQRYVDRIEAALTSVDPAHAADYAASAAAYHGRLGALDTEIRDQLGAIPADRRRVVSYHQAFPWFASAYGLDIVSTVLPNPGQEPSAADIAALIELVRAEGVSAIFADGQFPDDLAATIAAEAGIPVIRGLHSDSLGESPADSYEGMMRDNLRLIVEALG